MVVTRKDLIDLLNDLQNDENCRFCLDYWDENAKNPFEWKLLLEGKQQTIYENGYFIIKIIFTESYPETMPTIYFKTKIYHANIRLDDGYVCIKPPSYDILDILDCLDNIFDSCNAVTGGFSPQRDLWKSDLPRYEETAKEYVRKYATLENHDNSQYFF